MHAALTGVMLRSRLLRRLGPRPLPRALRRALFAGDARYCPVCRSSVAVFLPFGVRARTDAMCPLCLALERHRLDWVFFERHTNLFDATPKRMLHVAPEAAFREPLQRLPALDYFTADLAGREAMARIDVTNIPCADETFDVIYCSHVLEHVPDDARAMRELRRVLKRTGWALLQVPVVQGRTDEDPTVRDPAERLRRFGQADHVRRYGTDYPDRLEAAGFRVRVFDAGEIVTPEEAVRMAVGDGRVYYCARA